MPNKLSVTLFAIVHGAIVHGAIVLGAMADCAAATRGEEFKQVQVANTERTNFAPGGLIRLDNSYGDVTVEGWDRPEVEVTVIKSMPFDYAPKHPELAAQHLELVGVAVEARRSDTELAIGTNLPPRKRRYAGILPGKTTGGVMLEYLIHVPYDSRLAIRHMAPAPFPLATSLATSTRPSGAATLC